MEVLEQRLALSGVPLEGVGTQPSGGLDGKIVYVHGGHGYTAANEGTGSWSFQRSLLLNMVEDLGNKDQMDFLVEHLFRPAPLSPPCGQLASSRMKWCSITIPPA